MKSMESAYNTLRNAEKDYKKNQIADPVLAEEMAYAENDSHKKKLGFIEPSEEQLREGQNAMFEKGVSVLAVEAEKIFSDIKILDVQKGANKYDGVLVRFEYDGHTYGIERITFFQQEENVTTDYFQLASVDDDMKFTADEEKMIIQKFETALRMKLHEMEK